MIEIDTNGRVRIIGDRDKRVVNFADRESELRFARMLRSPDVEVVKLSKGAMLVRKAAASRRPKKP